MALLRFLPVVAERVEIRATATEPRWAVIALPPRTVHVCTSIVALATRVRVVFEGCAQPALQSPQWAQYSSCLARGGRVALIGLRGIRGTYLLCVLL